MENKLKSVILEKIYQYRDYDNISDFINVGINDEREEFKHALLQVIDDGLFRGREYTYTDIPEELRYDLDVILKALETDNGIRLKEVYPYINKSEDIILYSIEQNLDNVVDLQKCEPDSYFIKEIIYKINRYIYHLIDKRSVLKSDEEIITKELDKVNEGFLSKDIKHLKKVAENNRSIFLKLIKLGNAPSWKFVWKNRQDEELFYACCAASSIKALAFIKHFENKPEVIMKGFKDSNIDWVYLFTPKKLCSNEKFISQLINTDISWKIDKKVYNDKKILDNILGMIRADAYFKPKILKYIPKEFLDDKNLVANILSKTKDKDISKLPDNYKNDKEMMQKAINAIPDRIWNVPKGLFNIKEINNFFEYSHHNNLVYKLHKLHLPRFEEDSIIYDIAEKLLENKFSRKKTHLLNNIRNFSGKTDKNEQLLGMCMNIIARQINKKYIRFHNSEYYEYKSYITQSDMDYYNTTIYIEVPAVVTFIELVEKYADNKNVMMQFMDANSYIFFDLLSERLQGDTEIINNILTDYKPSSNMYYMNGNMANMHVVARLPATLQQQLIYHRVEKNNIKHFFERYHDMEILRSELESEPVAEPVKKYKRQKI